MTKNETLQAIFHLYETEHEHEPARTRDAVDWAISQGLLATPPPMHPRGVRLFCVECYLPHS